MDACRAVEAAKARGVAGTIKLVRLAIQTEKLTLGARLDFE